MTYDATNLREKQQRLISRIGRMGRVIAAFSGGVDSALLAACAQYALGDRAEAVTLRSVFSSAPDREDAEQMARAIGIRHVYLDVDELGIPEVAANGPRRCYYCKKERLRVLSAYAGENGYECVLDGANVDDLTDYRPGMAAARECGIVDFPLLECGFTKDDVREAAREMGLAVWNKPAMACLATRVAPQMAVERDALHAIDEAESFLRQMLPPDSQIRVRHHGRLARIEALPVAMRVLVARSDEVVTALRTIGYRYVTLDLGGYEIGSFNDEARKNV